MGTSERYSPEQGSKIIIANGDQITIGDSDTPQVIIAAKNKETRVYVEPRVFEAPCFLTVVQSENKDDKGREIVIEQDESSNSPIYLLSFTDRSQNHERPNQIKNRTNRPITVIHFGYGSDLLNATYTNLAQNPGTKSFNEITRDGDHYSVIQDGKKISFDFVSPVEQEGTKKIIRLISVEDVEENKIIDISPQDSLEEQQVQQMKYFDVKTLDPYRTPLEELWRKLLAKLQPRSEGDTDKDAAQSEILPQNTRSRTMLALITNAFKKVARAFTRTKEGKSEGDSPEDVDKEQPTKSSALKQVFKSLLEFFAQKRESEDAEFKEGGENDIEGEQIAYTSEDRQDKQVNARAEGSKPIAEAIKQEETEPEMTYEQLAERVSNRISDLRNAIDRGQEVKSDELLELSAQLQQLTQVLAKELEKVEGEVDFEKDDFLNIEDSTNPQINKLIELYKSTLAKVFDHPGLKSRLAELNIFVLPTLDKDTIVANIYAYGGDNNLRYKENSLIVNNGSTLISFGSSSIRIYQYGDSRTAIIVAHGAYLNDRSYSFISRIDNLYCSKNSQVFARYVRYADAIADQNDKPLILLKKVYEVGDRSADIFRSDYKLPISPGQQTISATRLRTTKKTQGNVQISLSPGESFEITNVTPP